MNGYNKSDTLETESQRIGRLIAVRRRQLGMRARRDLAVKTRTDPELQTSEVVYEMMLARIETGVKDISTLTVEQWDALLLVLEFAAPQFEEFIGTTIPRVVRTSEDERREDARSIAALLGSLRDGTVDLPVTPLEEGFDGETGYVGYMHFAPELLRPQARAVRVGVSDLLEFQSGDTLLIDTRDDSQEDGGIYWVELEGGVTCVRRLRIIPLRQEEVRPMLLSDDLSAPYPAFYFRDARVLGRVYARVRMETQTF